MRRLLLLLALLQAPAGPRGSIEGIVVTRGTALERLLPNARLELSGPGMPIVVRSDAGGKFVFSDLAPGRYRLLLTEDGFIRQEYGQRSLGGAGLPINVAAGQSVKNIVFRLDAAPTIAGWVQDEFGYAVPNILVQVMRRTYDVRGRATLSVFASAVSDDRGQYRTFWIDPGEYFASAMQLPLSSEDDDPQRRPVSFAPTYYPGVTDPEGIRPFRVQIGREVRIDFRMRRQGPAAIAGNISSAATGKPVSATVSVMPVEDANNAQYRGQDNAAGFFSIDNVAPGSYILSARTSSGDQAAYIPIRIPSVRDFFLSVSLLLSPPLQINGRITSGSSGPVDLRGSTLSLIATQTGFPSSSRIAPRANGQFALNDLWPGEYMVSMSGLPDDVYLQAATFGSSDALEGMTVRSGASVPLEVSLASNGGHFSVTVLDGENRLFPTAQVVLVPDAARRQRPDQYRVTVAGEDGRAVFRGVPPGDYKLLGWQSIEPNAYLNAEYMKSYEEAGVPVRVKPGENDAVMIRVIPADQ
jgi:hypothetical protein